VSSQVAIALLVFSLQFAVANSAAVRSHAFGKAVFVFTRGTLGWVEENGTPHGRVVS